MSLLEQTFTQANNERIVQAIALAEKKTSAEIRVHVDEVADGDVMKLAWNTFAELQMFKTEYRNAILIFVNFKMRNYAIIADTGLSEQVQNATWQQVINEMRDLFKQNQIIEAIIHGVLESGEIAAQYFPCASKTGDELSNEITFS